MVPRPFDFPSTFLRRKKQVSSSRLGNFRSSFLSTLPAGGQCPASRDQYPETAETSQAFRRTISAKISEVGWEKNISPNGGEANFGWCVFCLGFFCCSKNDIEVNYLVMIIPCFTGGWSDAILTRWWDLYDSLGAFFQVKCRFGKDSNLPSGPNVDSISFCSFAYLLPKLRVSPSDGWEDELPKFQCFVGKVC